MRRHHTAADLRDALDLYHRRYRQLDGVCRRAIDAAGRLRDIVEQSANELYEPSPPIIIEETKLDE